MLPIFSREQNDILKLRQSAQKALGFSFFLIAPCFIGFAMIAEPFTKLLLTDKWISCVPYVRVFCIYQLGILPYCILRNILYATGNSKRCLLLEILKAVLSLAAILIGMLINTFAVALFSTLAVWLATFAYGVEIHKQICFKLKELFSDFISVIINCLAMSIAILFVNKFVSNYILKILLDILTGVVVYILFAIATDSKYFNESFNIVKRIIKQIYGRK